MRTIGSVPERRKRSQLSSRPMSFTPSSVLTPTTGTPAPAEVKEPLAVSKVEPTLEERAVRLQWQIDAIIAEAVRIRSAGRGGDREARRNANAKEQEAAPFEEQLDELRVAIDAREAVAAHVAEANRVATATATPAVDTTAEAPASSETDPTAAFVAEVQAVGVGESTTDALVAKFVSGDETSARRSLQALAALRKK